MFKKFVKSLHFQSQAIGINSSNSRHWTIYFFLRLEKERSCSVCWVCEFEFVSISFAYAHFVIYSFKESKKYKLVTGELSVSDFAYNF